MNNENMPDKSKFDDIPTCQPYDTPVRNAGKAVPPSQINHVSPRNDWDNQDTMVLPPMDEPDNEMTKQYEAQQPLPPLHKTQKASGQAQQTQNRSPYGSQAQQNPYRQQNPYQQANPYQQNQYRQPQPPYGQQNPYQQPNPYAQPQNPYGQPQYVPPQPPVKQSAKDEEQSMNPMTAVLIALSAVMVIIILIIGGIFLFRGLGKDDESSASISSMSVSDVSRDPEKEELKLPDVKRGTIYAADYNEIFEHDEYMKIVNKLPENYGILLSDINGDGTSELFITDNSGDIVKVYTSTGSDSVLLIDCDELDDQELTLYTNGMIKYHDKRRDNSTEIFYLYENGRSLSAFEMIEDNSRGTYYSFDGKRVPISFEEYERIVHRYDEMRFKPILASIVNAARCDVHIETYDHSSSDTFTSFLVASGDFDTLKVVVRGPDKQDFTRTIRHSECDEPVQLLDYKEYSSSAFIEVTPIDIDHKEGDKIKVTFPTSIVGTIRDKVDAKNISDMLCRVNCTSGRLVSFDSSYVLDGGEPEEVMHSVENGIIAVAKREASNYDVHWFELWNDETGEYIGWVDEEFLELNYERPTEPKTEPETEEEHYDDNNNSQDNFDFNFDDFWNWFN